MTQSRYVNITIISQYNRRDKIYFVTNIQIHDDIFCFGLGGPQGEGGGKVANG